MIGIPRLALAWAASLALVAGWGLWHKHQADQAHAAAMQADKDAAEAEAYALRQSLRETERRVRASEEVNRDASRKLSAARRDAAAASAAADSLRQYVDSLAAGAAADDPIAAGGCATAADSARVLAELQRRADDRAGVLAGYADAARIAGEACERAYLSLTEQPKGSP